jgi:hypothetical protein
MTPELLNTPIVRSMLWLMTAFSKAELPAVMDAVIRIDDRRRPRPGGVSSREQSDAAELQRWFELPEGGGQ